MIAVDPKAELEIWNRALDASHGQLPPDLAKAILLLKFSERDHDRMAQLSDRCSLGALTKQEETELEAYKRVGMIISILWAKARLSLNRHGEAADSSAI